MSKINNRQWQRLQNARQNDHISFKNDSRVYCREARRTKFLYETESKAKTALKFNQENGAIRYYVCNSCMGYHLTSKDDWKKV